MNAIRTIDTIHQSGPSSARECNLLPANEGGTTIALIVLSALADTRRFADGLNFNAVGGNEWAARILSRGCLLA